MLEDVEAVVDTDLDSGATLLGDHLVEGSDLAGEREFCALVASFRQLVHDLRPAKALLVGPSAAELVSLLPTESTAHLLVRHVVDARAIAAVVTDRPNDHIFSGGFELFPQRESYDLVVVLGGGPVVLSPIAEGMSERQILAKAKSLLSPDGVLLYSAENALGLHDMLAAEAEVPTGDDRLWYVGKSRVSQRPWVHNELVATLEDLELHTAGCLLGFPSPQAPDLVVNATCTSAQITTRLARELPHAFTNYFSDRASVRNAGDFAQLVLQADLRTQLAPVWYFLLTTRERTLDLPALVVAEPDTAPAWSFLERYNAAGEATLTWGDGVSTVAERSVLGVSRTLTPGDFTDGTNLERALRVACAGSDHPTLRTLMKRYRAWLEQTEPSESFTAEQRWFAVPNNVIVGPDDTLTLDDPSWSVARPDAASAAFVHGVRTFATRLLAGGAPHPWNLPVTPDDVTRTLAAMGGVTVTPEVIAHVADIEVEIGSAIGTLNGDPEELLAQNLAESARENHLPDASSAGFRELLGQVRTLSQTVRSQERQVAWLEGTMKLRDRRIAEYDRLMFKLEESLSYKAMRTIGAPKRIAVARAKDRVDEALPDDVRKKARRLVKRFIDQQGGSDS
ncbi:hypothetical protein [Calidifontibacter terrae]